MLYRIAAIASLVSLSACGDNVAELARNADPKVCAASDTTETVFAIMKQKPGFSFGKIAEAEVTGKELLADITMSAGDITSKNVDKNSQTVECNATVVVSGKGLSEPVEQSVDYQVKPNLSDDSDIIVSVAQSDGISAIAQVAGSLLSAREKHKESNTTKTVETHADAKQRDDVLASTEVKPASGTGYGDCSIAVDGVRYLYIEKTCHIDSSGDDTSINTESEGATPYFAYISRDQHGRAQISWNSKEKWNKAEESLGNDFHSENDCWKNARATICASL